MINLKELSDADLEILKHDVDKEIQSRVKAHQEIWLEYDERNGSGKCWIALTGAYGKIVDFLKPESWDKNGVKGKKLFLVPLVEGNVYKFVSKGFRSKDKVEYFVVNNGKLEKQ